ncbi:MAG: hypothetical protein PVI21_05065 [Candidatus Woesebacteria bacterium]|jgi:hypothetical protein
MKNLNAPSSGAAAKSGKLAMILYSVGTILSLLAIVVVLTAKSLGVLLFIFGVIVVIACIGFVGSFFASKCARIMRSSATNS